MRDGTGKVISGSAIQRAMALLALAQGYRMTFSSLPKLVVSHLIISISLLETKFGRVIVYPGAQTVPRVFGLETLVLQ